MAVLCPQASAFLIGPSCFGSPQLRLEALEDRVTPSTGGVLDPTFGSGGVVLSTFTNYNDVAQAITVQPDGKIVIAGITRTANSKTGNDFLVARYNTDGSLDTSFGSGGYTATDFAGNNDYATALALQPQSDGTDKILVAGYTLTSSGSDLWRCPVQRERYPGHDVRHPGQSDNQRGFVPRNGRCDGGGCTRPDRRSRFQRHPRSHPGPVHRERRPRHLLRERWQACHRN